MSICHEKKPRNTKKHYDSIINEYAVHYNDETTYQYRCRHFYGHVFDDQCTQDKFILDAMCGSGEVSRYLFDRGYNNVIALDLSQKAVELYQKNYKKYSGFVAAIEQSGIKSEIVDHVVVCGGLHHLHPHLDDAVIEIHRILKPNGLFTFIEPHAHSIFDCLRRIWYKFDPLFEDNERALNVEQMGNKYQNLFKRNRTKYIGNIAYLLINNSMVFRIPLKMKKKYALLLEKLEAALEPVTPIWLSCLSITTYQKNASNTD